MRKLKLQVQMTVDGYIGGPNGETDWVTSLWTEDINKYVQEITDLVDCIILGRKLAEGFIPHWATVAANPDDPEFASGKQFTDISNLTSIVAAKLLKEIGGMMLKTARK